MKLSHDDLQSRIKALVAKWRHEGSELGGYHLCADELEALLSDAQQAQPYRPMRRNECTCAPLENDDDETPCPYHGGDGDAQQAQPVSGEATCEHTQAIGCEVVRCDKCPEVPQQLETTQTFRMAVVTHVRADGSTIMHPGSVTCGNCAARENMR